MAKAVSFREYTPQDSRDDLVRRVQSAPVEHAEAVLASYDLLQRMHEKGVIDLFSGLLSAGDTVIERLADVVNSKQAVTALRMALTLGNVLTSIDPDKLHAAISGAEKEEPPSLLSIVRQASSKDARRGMAFAVGALNALGGALNLKEHR